MTDFTTDSRTAAMRANALVVMLDHWSTTRAFVTAPDLFRGEIERENGELCVYAVRDKVRVLLKRLPNKPESWEAGAHALAEDNRLTWGDYTVAVNRAAPDKVPPVEPVRRSFAVAPVMVDYVKRSECSSGASGYVAVWNSIVTADAEQCWSGPVLIDVEPITAEWLWRLAHEVFVSTEDADAVDLMRCIGEAFPDVDVSRWL